MIRINTDISCCHTFFYNEPDMEGILSKHHVLSQHSIFKTNRLFFVSLSVSSW